MKLCSLVAALALAAGAGRAVADDGPLYACAPVSAKTTMTASFKPDVSVAELAVWVASFTCESVVIAPDVAKHATRLQIISPSPMTPKQAVKLFIASLEAAGLRVKHKDRTFTVTLGPGMPRSCPDVVAAAGDATDGAAIEAAPPMDADRLAEKAAAGIHRIDDTHVQAPRALLDQVIASPEAFSRGARVVPATVNGAMTGFRVYAIRPGGVYARLGLVNGDIVTTIAGQPLDTMDHALDAYTALRTATTIDVAVVRRGKPVTLTVTITP